MTEDEKEHIRDIATRLYEDDEGTICVPFYGKVAKSVSDRGYWVEAAVWVGEDVVHGEQQTLPDA